MASAAVFVRHHAAQGVGHTGWTFDYGDGTANAGGVENKRETPITKAKQMDFWTMRTPDPATPMRQWKYDAFKGIEVEQPDPAFAWQTILWVSHHSFEVFTRNCMDDTYDVLRAFGVTNLPVPSEHWRPNGWFAHVQGTLYQLATGGIYIPAKGQMTAPIALAPGQIITDFPVGPKPPPPPWRTPGHSAWHELQGAMQQSRETVQPVHISHR